MTSSAFAACGKVTIADMNWPSTTLMAHLDRLILKHGYGCDVDVVAGDTMPTGTSMIEKGEPDIAPELWTNSFAEALRQGVDEKRLRIAGKSLSDGGEEGFWVPKYLVDKTPELATEASEIFVIIGLSGSGKSTLIRHLNRLIEPTEGSGGIDVLNLSQTELEAFRQHTMSMVFQRFALLPHRTALQNVAFGLAIQKQPKNDREEKAQEWLQAVGLDGYEKCYPAELSGGEQQRVGLARALCTDPDILLMDEAFSALDPLIRSEMQGQLIYLQSRLKKTIVFITHDLDEAIRIADRIAILKDGEISQMGTPNEILDNPADDYVAAFVRDVKRSRSPKAPR